MPFRLVKGVDKRYVFQRVEQKKLKKKCDKTYEDKFDELPHRFHDGAFTGSFGVNVLKLFYKNSSYSFVSLTAIRPLNTPA